MKTLLLLLITGFTAFGQTAEPWKKEQVMPTKDLAARITGASDVPVILNVGPMENIRGAKKIGATNTDAGINNLKSALASINKNKEVVIYCGCCSYANCPNIRPAFRILQEMGFKKVRVLDIPEGIKPDWVAKGYPVED